MASTAATSTTQQANGFISNIVQPTADDDASKVDYSKRFNRAFVNDAQGNVLYVNQGAAQKGRIENPNGGYIGGWVGDSLNQGNIQRQMVVGGEVLARYGSAPDSEKPLTAGNAPNYVSTAEFYVGASPMQLKGANLSPVSYTVAGGETLKDIARNVLGDASLWWRIAEANALALGGDTQLTVGQTLTVPKVPLSANSADTLQPYEPGKVIGSQDPVLPVPAAKGGGCGGLGKIIVLVVAVVVAAVTQQWWLVNMAANPYVAGAVGAAAGSVASQVVGMAIGEQDSFSWKSVGLAALSAGITNGLAGPGLLDGQGPLVTIARAATANALTQGIGVVTGLQKSFDWKGVAGAAAGAGVGAAMNNALGGYTLPEGVAGPQVPAAFSGLGSFAGGVVRGTLSGIAAGTAAAVARGGKVAIQQVATDAFGNAIGTSLAESLQPAAPSMYSLGGTGRSATGLQVPTDWSDGLGRSNDVAMYGQFVNAFSNPATFSSENAVDVAAVDRLSLSGVTSDTDDNLYLSIIANAQARDLQRSSEQARAAAYQARASQLSSDLYASGAGDVRDTSPAAGLLVNPETGLADFKYTSQRFVSSDDRWVSDPTGSGGTVIGGREPQEWSMSTQAAWVAATSFAGALKDVVATPLDLFSAGLGFAYTATTGKAADMPMFSSFGTAAQAGATSSELLLQMNPFYSLPVAATEAWDGVQRGDTRPLAALSGGMLGGALIARGTPYLPGYKASNVSLTGAAAQQLQRWGVPDWNIRLATQQPGVLYSNPLPVTLERVGPSSVGLGGSAPVAYGTPYRQLSSKAYAALQEKVKNRTITKDEWQRLNWSDRLIDQKSNNLNKKIKQHI